MTVPLITCYGDGMEHGDDEVRRLVIRAVTDIFMKKMLKKGTSELTKLQSEHEFLRSVRKGAARVNVDVLSSG